jgi:hypothetical protein
VNTLNSKAMRKYIYYYLLILLILGCSDDKKEIRSLFSNAIKVNEVFSKELTATSFTEYSLIGKIDSLSYSNYPKNIWKGQGWKVKYWGIIGTENELRDITSFLRQEKSKYNHNGKNKDIILEIDAIIDVLENKSEKYLVSYFYKEKPGEDRRPPASNKTFTGWLFFYYLDLEDKKMVRITNVYR